MGIEKERERKMIRFQRNQSEMKKERKRYTGEGKREKKRIIKIK